MHEIAAKRGGKCLSDIYINSTTKLDWQCSEGHIWKTSAGSIFNGRWCRICTYKETGVKLRKDIEEFRKVALERGGKLLSEEYINNKVPLLWECKFGHQWKTTSKHVVNRGSWCPICIGKYDKINELHKFAVKKGGVCLSKGYINNHAKLEWQCKNGHQWKSSSKQILNRGTWCPVCVGKNKTIEDMQNWAAKRGGKCLSEEYKNNRVKLKWECEKGHKWETSFHEIQNKKTWCPQCSKDNPKIRNNKNS